MEGQRWFDLCRWGNVSATMNAYFKYEANFEGYYSDASMSDDEIFLPISQTEVDRSNGLYQ